MLTGKSRFANPAQVVQVNAAIVGVVFFIVGVYAGPLKGTLPSWGWITLIVGAGTSVLITILMLIIGRKDKIERNPGANEEQFLDLLDVRPEYADQRNSQIYYKQKIRIVVRNRTRQYVGALAPAWLPDSIDSIIIAAAPKNTTRKSERIRT